MRELTPEQKQEDIYDSIVERGYGIVTLPNRLGLMVGPAANAVNCPPGWIFVDSESRPSAEQLRRWAREGGREHWPAVAQVVRMGGRAEDRE